MEEQMILAEFTNMHNQFMLDWNEAMRTGDTSSVEKMVENYYVAFFHGLHNEPVLFNKEEALSGMKQSVTQLLGAEKRFDNRVIRLRNTENAVVFYELTIVKEKEIIAKLFTVENWAFIDNKWVIAREIEEAIL